VWAGGGGFVAEPMKGLGQSASNTEPAAGDENSVAGEFHEALFPAETISTILVQTPPAFALWTAVAINAIPSTPSSIVGKSQSGGIGWPLTSASMAPGASR